MFEHLQCRNFVSLSPLEEGLEPHHFLPMQEIRQILLSVFWGAEGGIPIGYE